MNRAQEGGISPEEYVKELGPKMTLKNYNPQQWAALAKEAGMKYFIITAKHHDGFGMVDFPGTDYDIADNTAYGKDPMIPLAKAVRAEGLKFGFYFSQSQDWSKRGGKPLWWTKLPDTAWNDYVEKHAVPQIRHLLGGTYGKIDVLWFDSGGSSTKTYEGALKIWQELAAQPDIIVNKRLNNKRKGVEGFGADFSTCEQWIPAAKKPNPPWETCMTMNGGWGYNPADKQWKSADELIRRLCATVARGGNYLLNVGPRADGTWEDKVIERLKAIGKWMKVNGESIYGTSATKLPLLTWGTTTWKTEDGKCQMFCHIFDWPKNGVVSIPLKNKIIAARYLGDSKTKPTWRREEDRVTIKLNRKTPISSAATVLKLTLAGGKPEALPLVVYPGGDGSIELWADQAKLHNLTVDSWYLGITKWRGAKKESAEWTFKITEPAPAFSLSLLCAFNQKEPLSKDVIAICDIDGKKTVEIPFGFTGTMVNPENPGGKLTAKKWFQAEKEFHLTPGKHTLTLKLRNVPPPMKKWKVGKISYTKFPNIQELKITPVK